jgi:hypothetical protein
MKTEINITETWCRKGYPKTYYIWSPYINVVEKWTFTKKPQEDDTGGLSGRLETLKIAFGQEYSVTFCDTKLTKLEPMFKGSEIIEMDGDDLWI